jgi:hypothetical protein
MSTENESSPAAVAMTNAAVGRSRWSGTNFLIHLFGAQLNISIFEHQLQ